ncbi:unnamed protein product [Staurois parvus]|uniref:Uncharacterized protein n=1 Tax=Staurois parvus TaxID=386267 RepID=A0ABN9FW18_9NEOB|nr:unnamed protein product [Staurois parvus]
MMKTFPVTWKRKTTRPPALHPPRLCAPRHLPPPPPLHLQTERTFAPAVAWKSLTDTCSR